MTEKTTKRGRDLSVFIEQVLDQLGISKDTPLEIKTDGVRITIEPVLAKGSRIKQISKRPKVQKSVEETMAQYGEAFKELAKK